jgi:hypothetical protein
MFLIPDALSPAAEQPDSVIWSLYNAVGYLVFEVTMAAELERI